MTAGDPYDEIFSRAVQEIIISRNKDKGRVVLISFSTIPRYAHTDLL